MTDKKSLFSDIALLLVTMVWGLSFPLIRNALSTVSDTGYVFYRFLIAAVCVFPFLVIYRKKITKDLLKSGVLLGFMLFLVIFLTVTSLRATSAVNVSFFTGASVALVPLLSVLIYKIKITKFQILSSVISILGILLLIGNLSLDFSFGNLAGVILAICVAAQLLVTDNQAKKGDALILGFLQIFICSFFSSAYYIANGAPKVELNSSVIIALFVTGLLSTAVAFTIQVVAQKYTTPLKTALIFSCEPVFGALFSAMIPKSDGSLEYLTMSQVIGCLLILIAIFISDEVIFSKIKKIQRFYPKREPKNE